MSKSSKTLANFAYDDTHIAHLTERCPKLGEAITQIGKIERPVNTDLFSELMRKKGWIKPGDMKLDI